MDRVTEKSDLEFVETIEETIGDMNSPFEGADELWNQFQSNLENFVNNNSNDNGIAEINTDYISRPDWQEFLVVCHGEAPINTLDNFYGDCID